MPRGPVEKSLNTIASPTFTGQAKFADGTAAAPSITFASAPTKGWYLANATALGFSGHLLAGTDNTYDIGANGATRPRHLYVGTSVRTAGYLHIASFANIFAPADGVITLYDNAQTSFSRLQFGGTTSAFPAWGRSGSAAVLSRADATLPVNFQTGTGSPESAVTAPVGSVYFRTDGGASTTFYVKESGAGNTGWVAK